MKASISRIRFIISQDNYWRKKLLHFRIGLYILCIIIVFYFSMASGFFNIYYYFLGILKTVIAFSILMAVGYFIVSDRETYKETYNNWHDSTYRNKDIQGKLMLAVIEGLLFLVISTVIFGLFYLSGFPYDHEQKHFPGDTGRSPLRFSPSQIEGVLFAFIIFLHVVALFTSIYWIYARCFKVIGFNKYKKIIFLDIKRLVFLIIGNFLFWNFSSLFLDHVYFNFIYPDAFANFHFLDDSLFASKPYLYLIMQLGILVAVNLFYIIDGTIANKYRTNFIDVDPLTTVD